MEKISLIRNERESNALLHSSAISARWMNYFELTKPRLLTMVLVSTAAGFYLASGSAFNWFAFAAAIIANAFVGGGAMALNEYWERGADAKMVRTMNRPIPSKRVGERHAFLFGSALVLIGLVIFAFLSRGAFVLAFASFSIYLFFYTPLKMQTSLATFVGAVSGALPPLIGWASAGGPFNIQALALFLILFFWQLPHFLAIDWMYRADYARAGFRTLAVLDPAGRMVARQAAVNTSALWCASLLPSIFQMTGTFYFIGAFLLGLCFSAVVLYSILNFTERARFVLRASIIYLPLLLILMVLDKVRI